MKTKNYLSIISILFFSFLFVSCSKEDEGDTIKPVIDLLEPEEGAILRIGSSHGVHFEMNLHDNEAIASYKINIHNNFDGHSHTRASEAGITKPFTFERTYTLVISVFFWMNLATPFVPNFLLLDEPVANIDDLNVLALMDFLREIAVTHRRQIFFTTANQNVAKLFRRKFSFLLDDFQELRFFREEEHNLQITKRVYDQSRLLENEGL